MPAVPTGSHGHFSVMRETLLKTGSNVLTPLFPRIKRKYPRQLNAIGDIQNNQK
jgi:hypothetical protein